MSIIGQFVIGTIGILIFGPKFISDSFSSSPHNISTSNPSESLGVHMEEEIARDSAADLSSAENSPQNSFESTQSRDSVEIGTRAGFADSISVDENSQEVSSEEFMGIVFPKDSYGDPGNSGNIWWPVFIDTKSLEYIQSSYCRDAMRVVRDGGQASVQVASFSSLIRAEQFSRLIGGDVGQPLVMSQP